MKQFHIHDDTNLMHFVIPGLTPYRVRGRLRNPGFLSVRLRRTAFAGMTGVVVTHDAVYRIIRALIFILLLTFMGLIFVAQASAQPSPKEPLLKGKRIRLSKKWQEAAPERIPFLSPPAFIFVLRLKG